MKSLSIRHHSTLVGSIAFLVYFLTLAPDLTWGNYGIDSGELITAAVTLGVPHPPGYPTYTLFGKIFSFLPVGSIAYRFNLFSAISIAIATGFIVAITGEQFANLQKSEDSNTKFRMPSISYTASSTGLVFAFAPLVWSHAIITEVYGLNLAFLAAFLWALLGKRRSLLTGSLLGLSITTHLTSILMLPLAIALVPRRHWFRLGVGFLLGLFPLLSLPWLSQGNSPVVWGDSSTIQGWWWLVSGHLYHNNIINTSYPVLLKRLFEWFGILFNQFTLVGIPLIIFPFFKASGSKLQLNLGLLVTAVFYLINSIFYSSNDAIVLTLPALLLFSILLAPGLRQLGWWAVLLPLASVLLNFGALDFSSDRTVRPLAEELLYTKPQSAILLTPGDQTIFILWYFQHIEEQRTDLVLVDANLFAFDWYRDRLHDLYPNLQGLEIDDLVFFRQANQQERPFCTASIQLTNPDDSLDCISAGNDYDPPIPNYTAEN